MVKKVLLALFLAFAGILLLVNSEVLATKEGYVDCGEWNDVTETCSNCDYNAATCADGCPGDSCDCGSNCPVTPPPPPPPSPTPPPDGGDGGDGDGGCVHTTWGPCSNSCGAGTKTDNCGDTKPCNTRPTAPTDLSVSKYDSTTWTLTWTKGIRGTKQLVYVGDVKAKVEANCPDGVGAGRGCVVKDENVNKNVESYDIISILAEGTVYYFRVVTYRNNTCRRASSTIMQLTSCNLSPSPTMVLDVGETQTLTTSVLASTEINRVEYTTYARENVDFRPSEVSLNPTTDNTTYDIHSINFTCTLMYNFFCNASDMRCSCRTFQGPTGVTCSEVPCGFSAPQVPPYSTQVTGVYSSDPVITKIKSSVYFGSEAYPRCESEITADVTSPAPPGPWWQAEEGNVHANGGDVRSPVPDTATLPYLITGTQAGLVSYSNSVDLGSGTINQNGSSWQAKTSYQGLKTDYGYFKRILEDDPLDFGVWDGSQPGADGVYAAEGDISTSGVWDITTEKIVILANGKVTITDNINVVPGGFLAIISSGNITIGNTVTNVEGVYVADGVISSGDSESQLIGEGIFTGWQGVSLNRDFNTAQNNFVPVERFIYRPDLVRNAYRYLLKPKIAWQEVAP